MTTEGEIEMKLIEIEDRIKISTTETIEITIMKPETEISIEERTEIETITTNTTWPIRTKIGISMRGDKIELGITKIIEIETRIFEEKTET